MRATWTVPAWAVSSVASSPISSLPAHAPAQAHHRAGGGALHLDVVDQALHQLQAPPATAVGGRSPPAGVADDELEEVLVEACLDEEVAWRLLPAVGVLHDVGARLAAGDEHVVGHR